jgi:hypothetical protein
MKGFLIVVAIAAITMTNANADVGFSVNIGQPGFYGRIDTNGYPQPQVIYRQPKMTRGVPANQPPVYMRVPPNHAKNWQKHCGQYNACDDRVLFVKDRWYNQQYAPRYQEQHGNNNGNNRGNNNNGGNGWNR